MSLDPHIVELAARLKLLSNPNRLTILQRLLKGEMSVGEIATELGIRQPTLSRELGHLREAGIITPRRQSKVVFYSLSDAGMRRLLQGVLDQTVVKGAIAFDPRPKFNRAK